MWETILGIVISSVISSVLSIIFSDKILSSIQLLLVRLGLQKDVDLSGRWIATFDVAEKTYTEIIDVSQRFRRVTGRISDDKRNYNRLHSSMKNNPLRVRGNISDNLYFTGFWYHPIEHSRHYGTFQLIFDSDNDILSGKWIGFSNSSMQINSGSWIWKRDK